MATFLDKNKKKSALAALLLFIRTRKTVTALLLLVALASFLFVSPSNLLLSFPGGARLAAGVAWVAGKVGMDTSKWGLAGGKRDYGDLVAAFRSAKEGGGKAGWAAFMRGGSGGGSGAGMDGTGSIGFVKGSAKDLEAAGGSGKNLPTRGGVEGVLNPDDAKNRAEGEGVALAEGDVGGEREGLVKSAFAGGFGAGSGAFGNSGGEGGLSGGVFASLNFFGKGGAGGASGGQSASSAKLGDLVKNGLQGTEGRYAKGTQIQGAAKGQMSRSLASTISARTNRGLVGSHTISGQRAFVQLAAGRGRAAISVAPNCTPGTGCPAEFAATNTGSVYDGNSISGDRTDILTGPTEIGDVGDSPNLPDSGLADDYIREAEKMDADARKCRELDEKYGPQELAFDKQQESLSREFDSMGCGQGGCSKSKAKACQRMGDRMKDLCRASMGVRCKHIHECPLTAKNNCSPSECDGQARNKSKIVDMNDDAADDGSKKIRTSTRDQGEAELGNNPACISARERMASAKLATQNAIDGYRGASCEALRSAPTLADKVRYATQCSGREGQVVNNCKSFAGAVCEETKACAQGECSGNSDACVITDLKGIEEFISK